MVIKIIKLEQDLQLSFPETRHKSLKNTIKLLLNCKPLSTGKQQNKSFIQLYSDG